MTLPANKGAKKTLKRTRKLTPLSSTLHMTGVATPIDGEENDLRKRRKPTSARRQASPTTKCGDPRIIKPERSSPTGREDGSISDLVLIDGNTGPLTSFDLTLKEGVTKHLETVFLRLEELAKRNQALEATTITQSRVAEQIINNNQQRATVIEHQDSQIEDLKEKIRVLNARNKQLQRIVTDMGYDLGYYDTHSVTMNDLHLNCLPRSVISMALYRVAR
ncbi:hypothetical protein BDV12DRAFT_205013 [Aspergillus spectabilis]